MNYDFEGIKELTGTLVTLDNTAVVLDVYMVMNSLTSRKLASVLRNNKVTSDNQDLFFDSITINKNSLKVFVKGQDGLVKEGNRYIMTATVPNPERFHGMMQALVRGTDGEDYACEIELGNIGFNLNSAKQTINEESITFENVSGMLYPFGRYQVIVSEA